ADARLVHVIGSAANQALLGLEMRDALRTEPIYQALHLRHHLGADAVAGEKQQFVDWHESFLNHLVIAGRSRHGEKHAYWRGLLKRRCAIGKTPLRSRALCKADRPCHSAGPAGESRESA